MIGTGFISNQMLTPFVVLFLDGGDFSNNLMTGAMVLGTSDEGRYYNVNYQGCYFRIPLENVKFMVEQGWMIANNKQPVVGWTEYTVDYSAYLQNVV